MMRSLVQPGPVAPDRSTVAECAASTVSISLQPGKNLLETLTRAMHEANCDGAYLRLKDVPVTGLAYVIPAHAPDADHVAWYSETFRPQGPGVIEDAGLFVGHRQGDPFIHCHGVWRMADGVRRMGHLLADQTEIAHFVDVAGHAISGARLETHSDRETNFQLFAPIATGTSKATARNALLCTVRPNEDIVSAIEAICRARQIDEAAIMGIGSLVGAVFEDGSSVDSHATEVLIEDGVVENGACRLDIALVGIDGAIHRGRLVPGRNGVCITFELLILPER